jgi:hypothetical protein
MGNIQKAREKIFTIYSRNLSWVKKHPDISFDREFDEGYICPLCFDLFYREDLSPNSLNPLCYEHNPPRSMGGKAAILTCKACNSKAGHTLDKHLLKRLEEIDFLEGLPGSKARTVLDNSGLKITADLINEHESKMSIHVDRKNSNPDHADQFFGTGTLTRHNPIFDFNMDMQDEFRIDFTTNLGINSNDWYAEVALLKIAYLIAFEKFGNGFIINPELRQVREQILNPDRQILPGYLGLKQKFPDQCKGINIINRPEGFQCFLVVFDLQSTCTKRRFAVILPGFDEGSHLIYERLKHANESRKGSMPMNVEHLWGKPYSTDESSTFISLYFWKKMLGLLK